MDWNQITELPTFWLPFKSLPLTLILVVGVPMLLAWIISYAMFKRRVGGVYFAIITQALVLFAIDPFVVQIVLGALILWAVGINRFREIRVAKINEAMVKVLKDPAVVKRFADLTAEANVAVLGKKLGIPAADAKEDEIIKFHEALRPGKAEDYELTLGEKPDEEFVKSFRAAADEAGLSRLYAGIHYRFAVDGGKQPLDLGCRGRVVLNLSDAQQVLQSHLRLPSARCAAPGPR